MRRETLWASIYSDISKRMRASELPNRVWARLRHSWVLPTPLGPSSKKHPTGLLGSFNPSLPRRTARATVFTACSWPSTVRSRDCSSSSSAFRSC